MARNKNEWTHSGVTMTAEEGMYFSKWLNDVSGIYMNTLYPEERTKIVLDWLENHRNNGKAEN